MQGKKIYMRICAHFKNWALITSREIDKLGRKLSVTCTHKRAIHNVLRGLTAFTANIPSRRFWCVTFQSLLFWENRSRNAKWWECFWAAVVLPWALSFRDWESIKESPDRFLSIDTLLSTVCTIVVVCFSTRLKKRFVPKLFLSNK